jgi:DUF1680 family protein
MPGSLPGLAGGYPPGSSGYAPDGTAGRSAAFPLAAVRLLDGPFRANQARNTGYLLFLDPDRMLHTFRLNYGVPSAAQPCGGWEAPTSEVRGHNTGHLLSGLALTYANTGDRAAPDNGRYIVSQLAALQERAPSMGYRRGYLSATPKIIASVRMWEETGGYYTGLSPEAFKQQPMNYFPRGNPDAYATDYDNFACDNATGMETQAKFADTIYSRDARGVFVNLFIPSEVTWAERGITLRQTTGFPDDPVVTIEVTAGAAAMTLRVRVPSWAAGQPRVRLNGGEVHGAVMAAGGPPGGSGGPDGTGGWVVIGRRWREGDRLEVTLPMGVAFHPAPDQPSVQAVTYGPVVLAGAYGTDTNTAMPSLDTAAIRRAGQQPMTFTAVADGKPVTLIPVARAHHQHCTVYWRTADCPRRPGLSRCAARHPDPLPSRSPKEDRL